MAIYINGVRCDTLEQVEVEVANMAEAQRQFIINDFLGVQNTPTSSIQPVTNQQLRSALVMRAFQQNKPELHPEAIRAYIDSLPEPNRSLALQQWEYSNEMLRNNPLVNSLATGLGLTSTDLDNIWIYAGTL